LRDPKGRGNLRHYFITVPDRTGRSVRLWSL